MKNELLRLLAQSIETNKLALELLARQQTKPLPVFQSGTWHDLTQQAVPAVVSGQAFSFDGWAVG